ncbi:MAG: IS30 family transposase [Bacteroidota bacterium]
MRKKYCRISLIERIQIETFREAGLTMTEIADKLSRNKSSISRELSRYPKTYSAIKGELQSNYFSRKKSLGRKLDNNPKLLKFVMEHLKLKWSPDQISIKLKELYPDDKAMQLSHESLYTYIYLLPRGELRKEMIEGLRHKKKSRKVRNAKNDKRGRIQDMISIEERPAEVTDRSLAGHWEGDLVIGRRHQSAIGTIVERKTRTVILVPLKNRDPFEVRKAFEKELKTLPEQIKKSLTYDQGYEMIEHKLFTRNTKMKVYFCHPASPWERGTCENTNMLIRGFFPKGTNFNDVSRSQLKQVQRWLNERPRKTLNYKTPAEIFKKEILDVEMCKTNA